MVWYKDFWQHVKVVLISLKRIRNFNNCPNLGNSSRYLSVRNHCLKMIIKSINFHKFRRKKWWNQHGWATPCNNLFAFFRLQPDTPVKRTAKIVVSSPRSLKQICKDSSWQDIFLQSMVQWKEILTITG